MKPFTAFYCRAKVQKHAAATGTLTHNSCQAVARTDDGTPDQLSFLSSSAQDFKEGIKMHTKQMDIQQQIDQKKVTSEKKNTASNMTTTTVLRWKNIRA